MGKEFYVRVLPVGDRETSYTTLFLMDQASLQMADLTSL